jgi:hypothetical protein
LPVLVIVLVYVTTSLGPAEIRDAVLATVSEGCITVYDTGPPGAERVVPPLARVRQVSSALFEIAPEGTAGPL